jgi:hypothetical protein
MTDFQASKDWLGSPRTNLLAWWIPHGAIVATLLAPVPTRSVVWIVALIWMGTACILNSKRCGRTHCRYTGPYYFAMVVPTLALGSGIVAVGIYGWLVLASVILLQAHLVANGAHLGEILVGKRIA